MPVGSLLNTKTDKITRLFTEFVNYGSKWF
jgi:hypothetical protein